MFFLIDSANLKEIREAMEMGFVHGVTTNTREIAYHASDDIKGYLREMRKIARGTIYVQVTVEDAKGMVEEGRAIAATIDQVGIKVPVTLEGIKAIMLLSREKITVAATAVNTVTAAILAARAGARSVIPYYGLLEDFEADSSDLLADITAAFRTYRLDTELIYFARNAKQVRAGIRAGANGCLMPLAGLRSLFDDPLSAREVAFMNSVWRKRFGERTWARPASP